MLLVLVDCCQGTPSPLHIHLLLRIGGGLQGHNRSPRRAGGGLGSPDQFRRSTEVLDTGHHSLMQIRKKAARLEKGGGSIEL